MYFGIPPGLIWDDVSGWHPNNIIDQQYLDGLDTGTRHLWLQLFSVKCECKECLDNE